MNKKIKKIICTSLLGALLSFNLCGINANAQEQLPLDDKAKEVFSQFDEKEIISSSEYARGARRVEFKRGGALAWSKNIIDWAYSGGKVTKSVAMQEAGFIFPNVVKKLGIKKLDSSTSKKHRYSW